MLTNFSYPLLSCCMQNVPKNDGIKSRVVMTAVVLDVILASTLLVLGVLGALSIIDWCDMSASYAFIGAGATLTAFSIGFWVLTLVDGLKKSKVQAEARM